MRRFSLAVAIAVFALAPARALASGDVFKQVAGNPADKLLAVPIDNYEYDYAKKCVKRPQKGMLALQSWLQSHSPGVSWGIMRYEKLSKRNYSLHSEGRALDWHLDAHVAAQKAAAERLIDLLLAPDRAGNIHALARRMGVQEIIFNCHAWFTGDGGMQKYSVCYDAKGKPVKVDDTTAHRNHVHIGLSWAGARMQTSFWESSFS